MGFQVATRRVFGAGGFQVVQPTAAVVGGGGALGLPVTAGLVVDIDPARIAGADNDPVEGTDFSGLGHHAVQATGSKRPLLKTNVTKGLSVLRFDGTDDFLETASFTLAQPHSVFAVAKYNSNRVGNDSLCDGQDGVNRMRVFRSANGLTMYSGGGLTVNLVIPDLQTAFHAYGWLFKGATSEARMDGAGLVSGNSGAAQPDGVAIGAAGDDSERGPVDIARFLVYDSELSSGDRILVEGYLNTTYIAPFITDTFTAADATQNAGRTPTLGGVIVHHATGSTVQADIRSNRLSCNAGGTALDYYPATPPSANYVASATIVGVTDNNSASMCIGGRIDPAANTGVFLGYFTSANVYQILQIVAGTGTTLGSQFSAGLPSGSGALMELVFNGNQVSARVDGVEIQAPTTTTVTAAGKIGTRSSGTQSAGVGVKLDNVSAV